MMEIIIPATLTVTLSAVLAFLTIFASIIAVYVRLRAQLEQLQLQFDKMAKRNEHADQETEKVKDEQAAQKTTVAVMAEQIANQGKILTLIHEDLRSLVRTKEGH